MKSDTVVSACAFSLRSDVGGGGMGGGGACNMQL